MIIRLVRRGLRATIIEREMRKSIVELIMIPQRNKRRTSQLGADLQFIRSFFEEIIFPLGIVGRLIGLVGQGSSYNLYLKCRQGLSR